MESSRHLLISILLSVVSIMIGTVGYMIIEGWSMADSLYMTIITISTVGYREVQPVSGVGRWFTMFVVISGVGFSLYVAGAVVQFMVEGRMRLILGRRRLEKKIARLKEHYIVCGYGRIGRVLCKRLISDPLDVVVIEKNRDLIPVMDEDRMLYISGDAADEANLVKAGIRKANGLVAVLATDTDNVFLVLTARQLNPDIHIMARASQEAVKGKLVAAGANTVSSPYELGAFSMAQQILRPTVTSFLDLAFARSREDIQMEEIPVGTNSPLANVELKDSGIRQQYNLILIAIKGPDGEMAFNPSFETMIRPGDTVIAVGETQNLSRLAKVLNA